MNMKAFFQKNWIHFAAVAAMLIVVAIYFQPQLEGYGMNQHDVEQWKGMAHETQAFRDKEGKEPLWTNSMFGGMPTMQITMKQPGNWAKQIISFYEEVIPSPMGIVFLHLIGFYIMGIFLGLSPLVSLVGAFAFSFASYEIIIIQAGHIAKAMATAFMPPALGAFVHAYRKQSWLSVLFFALFMAFELAINHVQVTYYFGMLLIAVGIYFFVKSITDKNIKDFAITTAGLIGAAVISLAINYGNLSLSNDYAKHTIRGKNDVSIDPTGAQDVNQSKGLDKDYITQWSYGIGETFTLISPNVKGGGSFAIGGSPFEPILENADLPSQVKSTLKDYPAYWGDQPFTSGPVYIGVVVALLAVLGMVFLKTRLKWPLFVITLLAIALSWGKNYMGLTNFFIDHVPFYSKFRTVTIILVLVELIVPVLGVLFLDMLIKEREQLKDKKNLLLGTVGGFFVFLLIVKFVGLGDGYSNESDSGQLASIEKSITQQILAMDPADLQERFQLDVNNPQQVKQFVTSQLQTYQSNFDHLKTVRKAIFDSSMNRSLAFTFFAGALVLIFVFTSISSYVLLGGMLVLTLLDVVPIAHQYLGNQEQGSGYKYWIDKGLAEYPIYASDADEQIMQNEIAANPKLKGIVAAAERRGAQKADDLGYTGSARKNMMEAERFMALNFETNYRVFDLNGGFNSSKTSYLHKSLGGYHGAKLRNINNLMNFHLSKMNNKVYDMMNVKYFIQTTEKGEVVQENPTAMGPVWLVKKVETYATPNDEIRALGSRFKLTNAGQGQFFVNGKAVTDAQVFGAENLKYVLPGSSDSIAVQLTNGMSEGMSAMWVMDVKGTTNLVPLQTLEADTAKSFLKLVQIDVEKEFKPAEVAVALEEQAKQLSTKSFTADGSIVMKSYAPNKLVYEANVNGKQLAVFSEVYYPEGWKAFVNGKEAPIVKVNYLLRAVELPSGKSTVELVFDLPKYHTSNLLSMIASILLLVGIGWLSFKAIKARRNEA